MCGYQIHSLPLISICGFFSRNLPIPNFNLCNWMAMDFNLSSLFAFGCVLFVFGVIFKLFIKLWWAPMRIQRFMRSQGIHGPSYKFIRGNIREIYTARINALAAPMGLSHRILPRVLPHVHSWLSEYGRNFIHWSGVECELTITDLDLVKELLHDRQKIFPKSKFYGGLNKIFGNGLVTAEGEIWAKSRKLANFAFHGETLKNMIPAMIACAVTMLEEWKHYEGKELDVYEQMKLYTSDVISHTAFGSSYEQGKNIFQMLQKLAEITMRNLFNIRIPGIRLIYKSKDDVEGERLEKRINDCFVEVIKKREQTGEADGYGNDFLGLLVKAKNDPETSQRISVDDIVDECKTFYFAGHETSSVLLAWTVFLLALHKEWQDKARDEVFKIFGDKNPTSEGLTKLRTMTMILNECLRLYPPAMPVSRKVVKEARFGNLVLPALIKVSVPVMAIHHDTTIWGEDASEFKPERFSEGVAGATESNSAAYMPFGLGPRSCVGMNFAMNEAKIALSMILQRYSFILSPAYTHSPVQLLTVSPQHGVQVILHSISDHGASGH